MECESCNDMELCKKIKEGRLSMGLDVEKPFICASVRMSADLNRFYNTSVETKIGEDNE